jgi:hypothetical protein
LRTIFWVGFIVSFVGIVLFIEIGSRLVSRFKIRPDERDVRKPEQHSLLEYTEMLSTDSFLKAHPTRFFLPLDL